MTIKPIPTTHVRIPQPPAYPGIGNVLDIDIEDPIASIVDLHHKYGPIIALKFPKLFEILVGSQELCHELCDQDRFKKTVGGALEEVRSVAGDGKSHLSRTFMIVDELRTIYCSST
jgi:cytochrome P450/NADPH-cytochrome P450 reductase